MVAVTVTKVPCPPCALAFRVFPFMMDADPPVVLDVIDHVTAWLVALEGLTVTVRGRGVPTNAVNPVDGTLVIPVTGTKSVLIVMLKFCV